MKNVETIDLKLIRPNRSQPRLAFYEKPLQELADSIKENGLLQPIVVRRSGEGYELIAGERRYRAHELLGYPTIEAIVLEKNDDESADLALIENMQREGLSAIEEARAMQHILETRNLTQAELAKRLGYRLSTVANKLRLLRLAPELQED
ncbi:MAG: ParB/RepB/Spo0J family partition protein, partial [Erysipelotrichaceae bacterium]|nr:ParB/RepB/Spo0J family partition protein [Erysipelotrichaceae bacterium]